MFPKIQNFLKSKQARQLFDVRNIALYIFGLVVLAIAWSGAKTVQNNYELQKQISVLQQQNNLLWLENDNTYLQNQFYQTNEYLELSARQNLGLAAPGEQVMLVPQDVAMKYVDPSLDMAKVNSQANVDNRPKYAKNLEDWRDFLLGLKSSSD
ncbi:MAG: FtsB family cell division protein [Candidatus Saccharimonadales bacterium]